ncbi:ABC transporter permease [Paenibacillus sanguinis]|uniref:ABC transporter permease n=1 Tax=Paenibacillus sanguinis TaxID=225906 RepID=UPI000372B011|nr:ABC transporter permease subunit [Paenibacillus sanguinis]
MFSFKGFYYALGRRKVIEFIIFSVFVLFFYLPLLNLIMLAFSNKYEAPALFPQEWGFKWWDYVLGQKNLMSSIILSFVIAIVTTLLSMCICLPAAYALARFEFPGRKLLFLSFLLSDAFPKMGLYVAIGIIFYKLNLIGTLPGVLLIHVLNSLMFMTWIPANAFRSVHRQQEEAARDAGAGPFRTFLHVTFPLALPGIIVAALFTFLGSLEEAQGTMLVGFPQFKTMPIEMYGIIMQYATTAGPVFSLILMIPTIIVLLLFRRYLSAENMANGFKIK